jgi:hypothetical protein
MEVRWFCFAALFALVVGCSSPNSATNAIPGVPKPPNAPTGTIGPKVRLRIAHLGRPHYFFNRNHFRAQPILRARSSYYYGFGNLHYGGGPVDVAPKAYLIFWGISSPADTVHDPDALASYITNFFAALPNSSWLNTVTQYYGTYAGPTQYITNPTVAFTGTYYDSTLPPSMTYTDTDAANEALKVANLYGYDANTNYIVVSPTGYTISGFGSQFCAYHSAATTSSSQLLSYTVFPYSPDAGTGCGVNSVTTPGTLDGVSIVSGHEEAETITDANAATGWLDSSHPEMEIGDKCAWIHLQDTSFPNGHSYPTQPLWSNASSSCVQSYSGPGPTPTPGVTPTPSVTPTPGVSPSPSPTNLVINPGFETGRLEPWSTCHSKGRLPSAIASTIRPHGGSYDAFAGSTKGEAEPDGITSVCQLVSIPAGGQLTFWTRGVSNDFRSGVYQFARLYNTSGTIAKTFYRIDRNEKNWHQWTFDLSPYANGQYLIAFGVEGKSGAGRGHIGQYVDDVSLTP